MYEGVVQDLIDELGRLPGVGPKSAQRIAFHLLQADPTDVRRLADVLIVTDDNPRSEDPAAIRAAILRGTRDAVAEVVEVGDRRLAIREALRRAAPGDVVLIAGKGHETGQEVHGEVHPFDDRVELRQALHRRLGGRG